MGSELSTETYPALAEVMNFDEDVWRDTVVVPPNGRTRIWVQYKNYTGKTVLHCHFLAHEDTGMMATLFIGPPDVLFHWKDHIPLLTGCGVGIVLGMACLAPLFYYMNYMMRRRSQSSESSDDETTRLQEYYYSVVKMNELKGNAQSKTID